jgi:methyltransferase-like protein
MIPDTDHSAFASFLEVFVESRIGRFDQHDSWDESALLHDELSAVNEPVYFHQFIEHARQHGLQYLAEAQFPRQRTQDLSADAIAQLHDLGPDRLEFEQYLDHVLHQTFRRTLLCHEEVDVRSTPDATAITDLYMASRARPAGADAGGTAEFVADDSSTFVVEHPLTTAALRYLHEVSPRAVHFPLLLEEARRRAGTAEPEDTARTTLSMDLLRAATCSDEQAELLGHGPVLAPVPSERPLASPVVRLQMHRSRYVATLRHEQMELTGLSLALVPLLDGRRTREDLLGELMTMVDDGRLRNSQRDVPRAELERQLSQALETTLRWLGRAGLLLA